MKHTWTAKIVTLALTACLAVSSMPVFADEAKPITVTFTDVTATDSTTLSGEAKVKVSVKGADGDVSIAQTALNLSGDLTYKSVQYLKGSDNPSGGETQTTSVNGSKITTGIISSKTGMTFGSDEALFVITFSGEAGKQATLSLSDLKNTYVTIDGKDYSPGSGAQIKVTASEKENKGKTAAVTLTMDQVTGFSGSTKPGITVKITGEQTNNYSIATPLNNTSTTKGGHRDATVSVPTYIVKNTVLADDTYTVEVSGIGYVTCKKTGVTFDKPLALTNADFVPGDVDGNGKVDKTDKAAVEALIEGKEYSEAADFNRDGRVNATDGAVFKNISDQEDTDSKDDAAGGGSSGGDPSGGDSSPDGGSSGGSSAGGDGSASGEAPDGSAGGDGDSSSGDPAATPDTQTDETFTDLDHHVWAKDAIYTLKDKGIISGISDTEFAPASNIKRGDFILIVTRMLGISDAFTENFADVPEGAYYYQAIGSAKAAGIAQGSGGSFLPEDSITRQDLITLAYRAFLAKGYLTAADDVTSLDGFGDKGDISDYAETAMASMVASGIIQGANGSVNPNGFATRAEVAVMCARLLELMA